MSRFLTTGDCLTKSHEPRGFYTKSIESSCHSKLSIRKPILRVVVGVGTLWKRIIQHLQFLSPRKWYTAVTCIQVVLRRKTQKNSIQQSILGRVLDGAHRGNCPRQTVSRKRGFQWKMSMMNYLVLFRQIGHASRLYTSRYGTKCLAGKYPEHYIIRQNITVTLQPSYQHNKRI